jgi:molecular chaperone HscB
MVDCWTCGAERGRAPFCPSCKAIQPVVRGASYFELFSLPATMGLDPEALERGYRDLSRRVHPDRFGRSSSLERKLALEQTTFANDAYRTLREPRTRAEYLMRLRGREVGKEEHRVHDVEFLDRMLELRDRLSEMRSEAEAEPLRAEVQAEHASSLSRLEAFFDRGRGDQDEAQVMLERLRFFERFLSELEARFSGG